MAAADTAVEMSSDDVTASLGVIPTPREVNSRPADESHPDAKPGVMSLNNLIAEGFSSTDDKLTISCFFVSLFVTMLLCTMLRYDMGTMFLATPFAMSFGMSLYFLARCKFKASRLVFWVAQLPVFRNPTISLAEREEQFKGWAWKIVALIRLQIALTIFILGFWGFLVMYDAEQDDTGTESTTELGVTTFTDNNKPENDNSSTTPQTSFLYGLFLVVVGPGLCMMAYGYLQWRAAKYMPSLEAFTCITLGLVSFHLYFFLLIFARGMGGSEVHDVSDISFFAVSVVMLSMNCYVVTILFYRNPRVPQMDIARLLNDSDGQPPTTEMVEKLQEETHKYKVFGAVKPA